MDCSDDSCAVVGWIPVQVMSAAARQAAFFAARDERMERDRSERSGEQRADDWAVPLTAALAWPLPELLEPDDASALLPLDDEDEDGASASEGLETMVQDVLDEAAESIFLQADGAGDGEGEQGGGGQGVEGEEGGGGSQSVFTETDEVAAAGAAALAAALALAGESTSSNADGPKEWRAVQLLPTRTRREATKRRPSRKTIKLLRWITKMWRGWVERKSIVIDGTTGPSWQQVRERVLARLISEGGL